MNIYEKIKEIAKEQGNQKICDIEKELEFANNTLSKWSKNIPSIDKVLKVATHFNVSLDYFVGRTVAQSNTNISNSNGIVANGTVLNSGNNSNNTFSPRDNQCNNLTEIEEELLSVCRNLDMRNKNALLTHAYDLELKNNK